MKSLFLAAALGAVGLLGLAPAPAHASWLSEALHRRFDPAYYYAAPVYDYSYYYTPAYDYGYYSPPAYDYEYVYPSYGYYYSAPAFYFSVPLGWHHHDHWWGGPRYYGHWHDYDHWHGGHGWHHHR